MPHRTVLFQDTLNKPKKLRRLLYRSSATGTPVRWLTSCLPNPSYRESVRAASGARKHTRGTTPPADDPTRRAR